MADFDAQLPIRTTAAESTVSVANASAVTINPAEDYAQGSTTSGQNGILLQGAVTTSVPTYTPGTTNPLSLDASGNLRVSVDSTVSLQNVNVTQWDSVALGSPSTYGTSPGAVEVIGVNAFVTNTVAVSGTVTANQGTPNTLANGWPVEITDGTNILGTSTHPVRIDPTGTTTQPVSGTVAVTQSTSPWVVSLTSTTITGTVAVTQSTSPWVTAGNLTHNNAAPTTNNLGVLPAVASTSAPTYTTGDQVLLSTDLAGNLRVTSAAVALQNVNVTQWDTTALGAPSAYGTSPGAVNVIGVNAFITNTPTVTANAGTGNFNENLAQVNGSTVATAATGIQKVGISDSAGTSITLGQKTSANSVPVVIASDQSPINVQIGGVTPVVTFATTASVASGSTATQTVSGPINLDAIHASGSGEIKVVIAIGVTGSEVTKWVGFTSAANKNFDWVLPDTYVIPSGSDVKITITNKDTAAQDLYSSVINH